MKSNDKKVMISERLFLNCVKIVCGECFDEQLLAETDEMLQAKLDQIVAHNTYTKYKTAPTEGEKEQARQQYLDIVGIHKDWRY